MGRKSKLTDAQLAEIGRRLLKGDKPADLARELNVNRSLITRRFSATIRNIKTVAQQIVSTEEALVALPVAQQLEALTLAHELRSISKHLAGAGKKAAMLSHRLIGMAHVESDKIDEANLIGSLETMKTVSALTKMANDASTIPLNLLAANKGGNVATLEEVPEVPSSLPADPMAAAAAYQSIVRGIPG